MVSPVEYLAAKAVRSPLWWLKRYLPASVPARYANYHRQLAALPAPGTSQARVVFRGAAKTTLMRGTIVHAAIHNRVRGVLLIRATYADAKADRAAMVRNTQIAGGVAVEDGDTKMVLIGDVPVWTRTPGGAVRGLQWTNPATGEVVRPDLIVVDDLETRDTARSKEQTRKISDWLFNDVFETADQRHPLRVVMLGTPITPTCLISQAMRRQEPFDTWLDPLVVPVVDGDGLPAWPANFDPDRQARTPTLTWAVEQLLQIVPSDTLLFPPNQTRWVPTPAGRHLWVGVDPAGDGADETGMAACCLLPATQKAPGSLHVAAARGWGGRAEDAPMQVARFVNELRDAGHTVGGVLFEANKGVWQFMVRETRQLLAPLKVQSEPPVISKSERALPVTLWQQHNQFTMDPALRGTDTDDQIHTFTVHEQTITGHDDLFDAVMWAAGVATSGHNTRPVIPSVPPRQVA